MSNDHEAPFGMFVSQTLTPLPDGVDVPPRDPDVSDTYDDPRARVAFTQRVDAASPMFASAIVIVNVSFEWTAFVDAVTVIVTTGPSRTMSAPSAP